MDEPIDSSTGYHCATKHVRNRIKPLFLDFENYPVPVKSYAFLNIIDIEKNTPGLDGDLHTLVKSSVPPINSANPIKQDGPDLSTICSILQTGYGVTGRSVNSGIPFFSRTVPSAGGLYPCHLYLAAQNIPGLETGVYYCDMIQGHLGLIQKGISNKNNPGCCFFVTGRFYISAWKYRERAFRYILLDAGHLVENLLLSIRASGTNGQIAYDFDDASVAGILSVDMETEIPLAVISCGTGYKGLVLSGPKAGEHPPLVKTVSYPVLNTIYYLGSSVQELPDNKVKPLFQPEPETFTLPLDSNREKNIPFGRCVRKRRSKRNFVTQKMNLTDAVYLLSVASLNMNGFGLELGFFAQNVESLGDGFYVLDRDENAFFQVEDRNGSDHLAHACLDQKWIANAAVNFLFMADLKAGERRYGARGYRYVFMQAGRAAQAIYLAAAGTGIGCCAVGAIYDDEAACLAGLSENRAVFYVVSAGPVKK